MIELDIAMLATAVTLLIAVGGLMVKIFKLFSKFEDVPERLKALEDQVGSLNGDDVKTFRESIDTLSAKLDNDYRAIQRISDSQVIMVEGMMNLFQHMINGNHVEQMQESYKKMEIDLMKSSMGTL